MKVNGEASQEERETNQNSDLNQYYGNSTAIIAYIPIFGIIIALVKNSEEKSEFTSFHMRQMFGIYCTGIILVVLGLIFSWGMLVYFLGILFVVLLWTLGLIGAVNREEKKVPIFGESYQKWFKEIS